jgi:predicted TPR repeat methyltransferase
MPNLFAPIRIYDPAGRFQVSDERAALIGKAIAGRSVLHIGCADWPVTAERLACGTLLHSLLSKCARSVDGIDLSEEGVRCLQAHGITNCRVADAERLPAHPQYEAIVAGDVLEHLSNAGLFIAGVVRVLSPKGVLVLAVPNCLSLANLVRLLVRRYESTHYEHTAAYTPKTVAGLCARYGLVPTSLAFTLPARDRGDSRAYVALRGMFLRIAPRLCPSIVMTFQRSEDAQSRSWYEWR